MIHRDSRHRTRAAPLPRLVQTAGFVFGGARFLEACRRRYGNIVTFRTVFDSSFVMLFDPGQIKQLFQGSPHRLHAIPWARVCVKCQEARDHNGVDAGDTFSMAA